VATTPRTRVYLTIDVECAEERVLPGRVAPAVGYDLRVWGRFSNQSEALGLPLILSELSRHRQKATFFVEVFGSCHFGDDGLREVCAGLRDDGQDVQLHAHPVQRLADWHTRGRPRPADNMADYSLPQQEALLREGVDKLVACGVDRATVLAFRAGNYGANNDTWRALAAAGLCLSSNLNLSYLSKNCRLRWPSTANALFETDVPGVWELPISNFRDGPGRLRHLQITAASFGEIKHYLLEARRLGLPEVTIVSHSFEFSFIDSVSAKTGRLNSINVDRLRRLLGFLNDHSDEFELDTVGALAGRVRLGSRPAAGPGADLVPVNPLSLRLRRYVEQGMKQLASPGQHPA